MYFYVRGGDERPHDDESRKRQSLQVEEPERQLTRTAEPHLSLAPQRAGLGKREFDKQGFCFSSMVVPRFYGWTGYVLDKDRELAILTG